MNTTPAGSPDVTTAPTSAIADIRKVPLNRLGGAGSTSVALDRIVPPADSARVPVAMFNASL